MVGAYYTALSRFRRPGLTFTYFFLLPFYLCVPFLDGLYLLIRSCIPPNSLAGHGPAMTRCRIVYLNTLTSTIHVCCVSRTILYPHKYTENTQCKCDGRGGNGNEGRNKRKEEATYKGSTRQRKQSISEWVGWLFPSAYRGHCS